MGARKPLVFDNANEDFQTILHPLRVKRCYVEIITHVSAMVAHFQQRQTWENQNGPGSFRIQSPLQYAPLQRTINSS